MVSVSVIVVNFNTYGLTCNCIDSVLKKTEGVEYEIILVDNASTECNPELFLQKFPSIKLVKSEVNLGFAKGNNLGISKACGKYILLLNSDTVLLNDAIALTVSAMESQKVSLATCKVYNEDMTVQPVVERFPTVHVALSGLLYITQIARKLKIKRLSFLFDYSKTQQVDWIWGCFFLFRSEILNSFPEKKLPEDFFMYGEDMLWCYLLRRKNILPWYFPFGEITHKFSGNKKSQDPETNMGFQNRARFLKRYYSFWRYTAIFSIDILILITRLKWKYAFKKTKYYIILH